MSIPTNDGGPAFPGPATTIHPQGMTLRDYFAAAALGSVLQSSGDLSSYYDYTAGSKGDWNIPSPKAVAAYSYELADAMIAERVTTQISGP